MATNKINITNIKTLPSLTLNDRTLTDTSPTTDPDFIGNLAASVHYYNGYFFALGYSNDFSGDHGNILRSTDFINWTAISVGSGINLSTSDLSKQLAYINNKFVLVTGNGNGNTNICRISSNNGSTWSAGGSLPTSAHWNHVVAGNGILMAGASGGQTAISSDDGASWTAKTSNGLAGRLLFKNGIWYRMAGNGSSIASSTNNGTTWTTIHTTSLNYYFFQLIDETFVAPSGSKLYISEDCINWTLLQDFSSVIGSSATLFISKYKYGYVLLGNRNHVFISKNLGSWSRVQLYSNSANTVSGTEPNTILATSAISNIIVNYDSNIINLDFIPMYGSETLSGSAAFSRVNATYDVYDGIQYYTDVTAQKGSISISKRLYIILGMENYQKVGIINASPSEIIIECTADGVPLKYDNATSTVKVMVEENISSGWTITITNSTGLTASISNNIITVTNITSPVSGGIISISAKKDGFQPAKLDLAVIKKRNIYYSGILPSPSTTVWNASTIYKWTSNVYSGTSGTTKTVYIKATKEGYIQRKIDSGSYTTIDNWFYPTSMSTPPGNTRYVYAIQIKNENTGSSTIVGTFNSWLSLSSDREWSLADSTSGTHRLTINLIFSNSTSTTGVRGEIGTAESILSVQIA